MLKTIRITLANLLSDKRGEDLVETSSGLSKGAKVILACVAITAAAGGTATLVNSANDVTDTAAAKVAKPAGGQTGTTEKVDNVYKGH